MALMYLIIKITSLPEPLYHGKRERTRKGDYVNDLININYNSERPTVLGRELHDMLGVETRYTQWFNRMCEYGFEEHSDFEVCFPNLGSENQRGGQNKIDHQLTIPMAKEICMLQRTERGKECRQYFIKIEEQWNSPDAIMQRALQIANDRLEKMKDENRMLVKKNRALLPDAEYGRCLQAKHGITTTSIAKELGMSAVALNKKLHELGVQYRQSGQWYLYRKYQDRGLTTTRTIPIVRFDGQPDVRRETLWTMKGHRFIRDLMTKTEVQNAKDY